MGQVAAIAAIGALGFAQYKAQGAAGKYNQAVQNRNAQIAEQEAAQIEKQLEFDFGKEYELEVEKILNQFSDNPNNLKVAHKAASLLNTSVTKRIINESNRPSNLDDTQNPKAQSGQNSEWKDLIIDND